MKVKLFVLKVLLLSSLAVYSQSGTVTKIPINSLNQNPRGYVEYLPADFDNSGNTKYAILYWLHGLGKAGSGSSSDLNKIYNTQICQWLKSNDINFIVVAPQDYNGYFSGPYPSRLTVFVNWVNQQYGHVIDEGQQHMAGLSAGGYGIRSFLIENDEVYRAFATFTPLSTNLNKAANNAVVQRIINNDQYVWIHHGTADRSPNAIGAVKKFHDLLYAADNSRSRLTAYQGLGHSAWNEVYDGSGRNKTQLTGTVSGTTYYQWTNSDPDRDWYGWMLAHGKSTTPPPAPPAPDNITLSADPVNENNQVGQAVGTLSSNVTNPISYTLVNGSGDEDNEHFSVNGNELIIDVVADFETQSSYHVRLEASNSEGAISEAFTIDVNDIDESVPSGSTITAKINFGRFNSTPVAGYNNIFQNNPVTSMPAVNLVDDEGNTTPWRLTVSNSFLSTPNVIGPNPGNNSATHPDNVLKYAWMDRYGGAVDITGLDNNATYTIQVYGNTSRSESRMQCWVNSDQIGGTFDVRNNAITSDYEYEVVNVSPVNGKITIKVAGDNSSGKNYGHLAAITMIQEPSNSNSGGRKAFTNEIVKNEEVIKTFAYPNPVVDNLTVTLANNTNIEQVELFQLSGQRTTIVNFDQLEEQKLAINMSGYRSGIYIMKIYSDEGVEVLKLLKR